MKRFLTLLSLFSLMVCQPEPAHADAFPDRGSVPADPARPGWRPPATRPNEPAAGAAYDFDPGRGPLLDPPAEDRIWLNAWGTWGPGTASVPLPPPRVVTPNPCRPPAVVPPAAVPGPLPIAGLAVAWRLARRLRRRLGQCQ